MSSDTVPHERVDPDTVQTALRTWAERIEQRELRRGQARLGGAENLDEEQRRALEALATAMVDSLLAAPERTLGGPDADGDTARAVVELFDLAAELEELDDCEKSRPDPELAEHIRE